MDITSKARLTSRPADTSRSHEMERSGQAMDSRQWATLFRIIARAGDENEFSRDEEASLMDMCADDESGIVKLFKENGEWDRQAFLAGCKKLLSASHPVSANVVVESQDEGQVLHTTPSVPAFHGFDFQGLLPDFGNSARGTGLDQIRQGEEQPDSAEQEHRASPDTIFGLLIPKFDGHISEISTSWCFPFRDGPSKSHRETVVIKKTAAHVRPASTTGRGVQQDTVGVQIMVAKRSPEKKPLREASDDLLTWV